MNKLLARIADRPTVNLVIIFVVLDLLALTCAWLYTNDILESRFYRLGRDRGLIEFIEYGKFALIIHMLLELWRRNVEPVVRALIILFSVMLIDNFIGIHEEVGELIVDNFTLPDVGLKRPKDLAEILVLGAVEGTALLYVIYCYFTGGESGRKNYRQFMGIFIVFACFSLVLDANGNHYFEESGEMVGMTLIMAWVHFRYRSAHR